MGVELGGGRMGVELGGRIGVELGGRIGVELGGRKGVELGGRIGVELGGRIGVELRGMIWEVDGCTAVVDWILDETLVLPFPVHPDDAR